MKYAYLLEFLRIQLKTTLSEQVAHKYRSCRKNLRTHIFNQVFST